MTFILLANGREFQLAPAHNPAPPPIDVIAHSLSQINRFAGHSRRPYSVAEHSLLVAHISARRFDASPVVQLACLMHDAHECITGDVASPVKQALGHAWTYFEAVHADALRAAYGLRTAFAASAGVIHQCDLIALATERRDLMPFERGLNAFWPVLDAPGREVEPFHGVGNLMTDPGRDLDPEDWCAEFTGEYKRLRELVDAQSAALMAGNPTEAAP